MVWHRIAGLILLLGMVGNPITVLADPPDPIFESANPSQIAQLRPRHDRPKPGSGFLQELNLTPDQTRRINAIRNKYQTDLQQRRQATQSAQRQLASLMAGNTSAGQIRQQFQQVQTLRQQLSELQFNSLLEMRDVLTPEQRRKFVELMQRRRGQLDF